MTEPFIAEIRVFACNFAPRGWAMCNGQLLPISQNTALFSLVGTTYGGNGQTTFALPNLQGRAAMHVGQGPGLTDRSLGEQAGAESVTLLTTQMPFHNHPLRANADFADLQSPGPTRNIARSQNANAYKSPGGQPVTQLDPQALALAGQGQPHNNMQPFLTLNFCIALEGIFPARN